VRERNLPPQPKCCWLQMLQPPLSWKSFQQGRPWPWKLIFFFWDNRACWQETLPSGATGLRCLLVDCTLHNGASLQVHKFQSAHRGCKLQ
jgi:hypothetical protein